jgi:hypothetical protein
VDEGSADALASGIGDAQAVVALIRGAREQGHDQCERSGAATGGAEEPVAALRSTRIARSSPPGGSGRDSGVMLGSSGISLIGPPPGLPRGQRVRRGAGASPSRRSPQHASDLVDRQVGVVVQEHGVAQRRRQPRTASRVLVSGPDTASSASRSP